MAKRRYTKKQKQLISLLTAVVVLVCFLVETVGPGWRRLTASVGLAPETVTAEGELEVHFIDVGNADCTLVRQGDFALLIDAGERGDDDAILDYLNRHGVTDLDLVVATHAHADHIGAMAKVIRALPVARFVFAPMPAAHTPTTATYVSMREALDEKQVAVEAAQPNAVYEVGSARLQILAPLQEREDTNDMSVVSRLTFGERAFLFTGDAGVAVEDDLLYSGCTLQADVLKVGHHGSTTSNSAAFLSRVSPAYAFIPCGEGNSYGHPHEEVLASLQRRQSKIYRSDVHGDVVFVTDGTELTVQTEKG